MSDLESRPFTGNHSEINKLSDEQRVPIQKLLWFLKDANKILP